jgi:hypothetical protein
MDQKIRVDADSLQISTIHAYRAGIHQHPSSSTSPIGPGNVELAGQQLCCGYRRLVQRHGAPNNPVPRHQSKNAAHRSHRSASFDIADHALPQPRGRPPRSLWLGHETLDSTNKYVHADMELKRRALDRTTPLDAKPGRYHVPDPLLAFLESL